MNANDNQNPTLHEFVSTSKGIGRDYKRVSFPQYRNDFKKEQESSYKNDYGNDVDSIHMS